VRAAVEQEAMVFAHLGEQIEIAPVMGALENEGNAPSWPIVAMKPKAAAKKATKAKKAPLAPQIASSRRRRSPVAAGDDAAAAAPVAAPAAAVAAPAPPLAPKSPARSRLAVPPPPSSPAPGTAGYLPSPMRALAPVSSQKKRSTRSPKEPKLEAAAAARDAGEFLLFTVIFHANHTHNLTRSP
jgi:hypothetical protein